MADLNGTHAVVAGTAVVSAPQIVSQLADVITAHGVPEHLAFSEAGLIVAGITVLGGMVWSLVQKRSPTNAARLVEGVSELKAYDPDYAAQAEAIVTELASRGAVVPATPAPAATVVAAPAAPVAPAAKPVVEPGGTQ